MTREVVDEISPLVYDYPFLLLKKYYVFVLFLIRYVYDSDRVSFKLTMN